VRVRLNRRHVRVVQRVFKTNTAVVALNPAQSEKSSVGSMRARRVRRGIALVRESDNTTVRRRGYRDNVKAEVA
jgi:hypothetical protein